MTGPSHELPLLPGQYQFLEQQRPLMLDPSNLNLVGTEEFQSVPLEVVRAAVVALYCQHAELSIRFRSGAEGWRQVLDADAEPPLLEVDLAVVPAGLREEYRNAVVDKANATLSLRDGPLIRFVLLTGERADTVSVVALAHHTILDGFGLYLLRQKLRMMVGRRPRPVPADKRWRRYRGIVDAVHTLAHSRPVLARLDEWASADWAGVAKLPARDDLDVGRPSVLIHHMEHLEWYVVGAALERMRNLRAEQVEDATAAIDVVLMAALGYALTRRHGGHLLLDVVHNGRTLRTRSSPEDQRFGKLALPSYAMSSLAYLALNGAVLLPEYSGPPGRYVGAVARGVWADHNQGASWALLRYCSAIPEMRALLNTRRHVPQIRYNRMDVGPLEVPGELGPDNLVPVEPRADLIYAEWCGPWRRCDDAWTPPLQVVVSADERALRCRFSYLTTLYSHDQVRAIAHDCASYVSALLDQADKVVA